MGSETDEELPNFSLQFSLTEGEMEEFIKQQRNPRTVKKTGVDVKQFIKFLEREPYLETRVLTEIPPSELDNYLCHYLLETRKPNGDEYEPDSLTSFRNSINRHLREQQYKYSLIDSLEFSKHREVLKAKRKQLKGKGKGRKPNSAQPLSKTDREKLYEKGYLGANVFII
mgnify:CR=1 FL=1